MKKFLLVTNNIYLPRGGEIWALELSKALKGIFKIEILFPNFGKTSQSAKSTAKKYEITLKGINGKTFKSNIAETQYDFFVPSLSGMVTIFTAISKADVVYCISSNPLIISSVIILSKLYRKKIIYGIHNPLFSKVIGDKNTSKGTRIISKFLLGNVDTFHALNSYDYRITLQKFPKTNTYLIPNFLSKIVSAKTITVNHDQFIVLFVGKLLKREKGLDFLSEIIKIVMKKSSGIHFHIIGPEGDSEELLKSLVKRYPNNVEVLGFMNKNKLERQYAGADLFVLTSRKETFGLALLEAQSYGIPAICFDVGGPSDIVKERFQGRIIQRFDTEGFAAAVLKYYKKWQDKERYLKVKKLINKTINLRYNKRNIISKLAKLLVE